MRPAVPTFNSRCTTKLDISLIPPFSLTLLDPKKQKKNTTYTSTSQGTFKRTQRPKRQRDVFGSRVYRRQTQTNLYQRPPCRADGRWAASYRCTRPLSAAAA